MDNDYLRNISKGLLQRFDEALPDLDELHQEDSSYKRIYSAVNKVVTTPGEEVLDMNVIEEIKMEGRLEGRQEGRREGRQELLDEILEKTGMTYEELLKMYDKDGQNKNIRHMNLN